MRESYLEVTFRHGKPIAAYYYLPRRAGERSYRTARAGSGLLIDFNRRGKAIGVEIMAPGKLSLPVLNRVLARVGASRVKREDLAPLRAA
jgi:uncharacterized protein YuzE